MEEGRNLTLRFAYFVLKKRDGMCINISFSLCCAFFLSIAVEFPLLGLMALNQFSSGDRFTFFSCMKVSGINGCCFHSHILLKKCLSRENFRHQNCFFPFFAAILYHCTDVSLYLYKKGYYPSHV